MKSPDSESFNSVLLKDKSLSTLLLEILEANPDVLGEENEDQSQYKASKSYIQIQNLHNEHIKLNGDVLDLEYQLKDHKNEIPPDIKPDERKRIIENLGSLEKVELQIKITEENIDKKETDISLISKDISDLNRRLSTITIDDTDKNEIYMKISQQLENLIDKSKDHAREKVHSNFEEATNKIHDIVKDPVQKANTFIRIDDNYGTKLYEKNQDNSVSNEWNPTGSQTLYISLSMNLALINISVHKLPLMLDNPFVTLSDSSEERVLKAFSETSGQKIITLFLPTKRDNEDSSAATHWSQIEKNDQDSYFYTYSRDATDKNRTIIEAKKIS